MVFVWYTKTEKQSNRVEMTIFVLQYNHNVRTIHSVLPSLTTDGALASGGDFIGVTCLTTFTAGSGPGNSSTPACNITINNDLLVEQDETFSLTAAIQNSNGQSAQFSAGGDSASTTITEIDGQLIMFAVFTFLYNVYREIEIFGFWSTYQIANSMCMNSNDVP